MLTNVKILAPIRINTSDHSENKKSYAKLLDYSVSIAVSANDVHLFTADGAHCPARVSKTQREQ